MGPFRPHKPISVDSTKENTHFIDIVGCSSSRMVEMHFFQGLSLIGINQYPSQLVSWMANAHLRELMVKHLFQGRMTLCQVWLDGLPMFCWRQIMSSRNTSTLLSLCRTCSMICCDILGAHFRPIGKCLYLILGLLIKFTGIILHSDIKFCKILVSRDFLHNSVDIGSRYFFIWCIC